MGHLYYDNSDTQFLLFQLHLHRPYPEPGLPRPGSGSAPRGHRLRPGRTSRSVREDHRGVGDHPRHRYFHIADVGRAIRERPLLGVPQDVRRASTGIGRDSGRHVGHPDRDLREGVLERGKEIISGFLEALENSYLLICVHKNNYKILKISILVKNVFY